MELTESQKDDYLTALATTGRVQEACESSGIAYNIIRDARLHDKPFAEAFEVARRHHGEQWERAAHTRGIEGWEEPVFHEGEVVGHKRKFSDRCLELGLKRFCPEYREKMAVDATISGGVLVVGPVVSEEEWRKKYEKKGEEDE